MLYVQQVRSIIFYIEREYTEIQFHSGVHMLPLTKKTYFEMLNKNRPKVLYLHIHNLGAFVKFQ
jgi:hypothetical protein